MATVVLNPYLLVNKDAEEALNFYKGIFGGTIEISRYNEVPEMPGMTLNEEQKNLVMHSVLKSDELQLMISDASPSGGVKPGDNVKMSLSGDDEAKLTTYFNGLCEGGNVVEPLRKAPWGDSFGMVVDKYGFHWMVNITLAKDAQTTK